MGADSASVSLVCEHCGAGFSARRGARTCSDRCRQASRRKRRRPTALEIARVYAEHGILPDDLDDELEAIVSLMALVEFIADENLVGQLAELLERHWRAHYL